MNEFTKERNLKELYYGRYSINDAPLVFDVDGLNEQNTYPNEWNHQNVKYYLSKNWKLLD